MSTLGEERGLDLAAVGAQSKEKEAHGESIVYGSATWFAEVVGLPNWGLDPRKDVNHVSNKDLFVFFQDKVSYKGYACIREKLGYLKGLVRMSNLGHLPTQNGIA